MNQDSSDLSPEAAALSRIFQSSLPDKLKLFEIHRQLGPTGGRRCVDVCLGQPMMSRQLRLAGGDWQTVVSCEEMLAPAREIVGEPVAALEGGRLPCEDGSADLLVLGEGLERREDDVAFVQECHRVLKSDGRLILCARHSKRTTLVRPLRRLLGVTPQRLGWAREGYSEKVLFDVLKNGFDVMQIRSYGRFLLETVDTLVRARVSSSVLPGRREVRCYRTAGLFYRLAFQLDVLFGMTKGHHWIVVGKKRMWRTRQAPVLRDGRTITEAVLSRS